VPPLNDPDGSLPLFVALTVDVDPDANRAVSGRPEAVSAGSDEATYSACARGLGAVLDELERRELPATIFWEGRALEELASTGTDASERAGRSPLIEHACHGYAHEDFAGTDSGVPLDDDATGRAIERATTAITAAFGTRPIGFRAPYCRLTPAVRRALRRHSYRYDASLTRSPSQHWRLHAARLDGASGVRELALCRSRDREGKPISGYLWQLFEGNRPASDYAELIVSLRDTCPGGLLQVALHPWHLFVSGGGLPLPPAAGRRWREFLDAATAVRGVRFVTARDYLERSAGAA